MPLDEQDMQRFRTRLEARERELDAEVREGIASRDAEDDYTQLAGEVGDPGDASVATEQSDLRNAQINRDVGEIRGVQAALARIEDGSYGMCSRCGIDIDVARLEANPIAERCIRCQSAYEKQYPMTIGTTI
jgi:RNA polymerase-binding protein DksA